MWDFLADVLVDVFAPDRWKDEDGHVDKRWFLLGFALLLFAVVGLVFGTMYLLGVH